MVCSADHVGLKEINMHFTLTMMALMILVMMTATGAGAQTTRSERHAGVGSGGGTLIVLNKDEASISLLNRDISGGGGEEFAKIAVGVGPHEVAVSPDGKTAVVCNYGSRTPGNSLSIVDLTTRKVTKTIDLGEYKRPHGIMYFADGKRIVVTSEVAKKLLIVDLEKGEVTSAIDTNGEVSHMVVLSPDQKRAYVPNLGSASISVIDLESERFIARVDTGEGAEGADVSPDGKEIWVGNRAANNVTIVDAATLKVVHTMDCPTFPIRCKFTPDGKYVLVSNGSSGDVVVFDAKSRKEVKRISMELKALEGTKDRLFSDRFGDPPVPVGILIPPDGRHAYVANTNADIITVIDLKTFEIIDRLVGGKEPDGLGWTPLDLKQ